MSSSKLVIVDYGLGNLFNLEAALSAVGANCFVSSDPREIANADRIVIPGVGSFADGMRGMQERNLPEVISGFASKGRPILGICLGMQLMLSVSEEWGVHRGLDLIRGRVIPLKSPKVGDSFKIPHIGWNKMKVTADSKIFTGIARDKANEFYMYFLHSYFAKLELPKDTLTETVYGADQFCSAFQAGNLFGFQPHPERSGPVGLQILKNFLAV